MGVIGPVCDHSLLAPRKMEENMSGYETIIIPPSTGNRRMNPGVPFGSRVVVNSRIHQTGNYRQQAWNNPRGGVIIHHLSSGPSHHRKTSPRIVEVTDEEEDLGIANPDYPVSEAGFNGRSNTYPSQLPANESPELPARDYHLHGNNQPDSRPDIQRLDLSGQNEEPSSVTFIPPAPPPPPPPPPVSQSHQPTASVVVTPEKPMDASSPSVQGSTETHAGQQLPEDHQGLHIVLRRALARFNDGTTQPTPESDGGPIIPAVNQEDENPDEIANKRASREIYTQTRPQQSAEVQTTPEQTNSRNSDDSEKVKRRPGVDEADRKSKSRSHDDRHSKQRDERYWRESDPQFTSYDHDIDELRATKAPYISGVDLEDEVRRASTIIERIIITREIDPVTGQPVESVPMRNMDSKPRPKPPPARPKSNHGNVVYNQSVRAGSGRRSRGWAPFSDWHGHWSPREHADPMDVSGIVAGMGGKPPEFVEKQRQSFGFMPGERPSIRRGRSNQGYNVSPVEERRNIKPNGERQSATQSKASARPESWAKAKTTATHPPQYTTRDAAPSRMRDRPPLPLPHEVNSAHRSFREQGWGDKSERSSMIRAGWTQKTKMVFAVLLLFCILLLLALVVVVALYFTVGPGSECVSGAVCGTPPLGYILAFAVIGFFVIVFTLIGLVMCCFACSISGEKRMQQYPVSG